MRKYMQIFLGTSFSSLSPKEIQILKDHLFCINTDGMIEMIVAPKHPDYQPLLDAYQGQDNFHVLAEGQYFLPGFIDLHVHAPQWAQSGTALDIPLYDWLNTYTFPLESKFSDLAFAKKSTMTWLALCSQTEQLQHFILQRCIKRPVYYWLKYVRKKGNVDSLEKWLWTIRREILRITATPTPTPR